MNPMIFIKEEEIKEITHLFELNSEEEDILKGMVEDCEVEEENNTHQVCFLFTGISLFSQKKIMFAFGELLQRGAERKREARALNINFN